MIRSNVRYGIARLAVAADLPLVARRQHVAGIAGEAIGELREVQQHPAVVAMQLVAGEHQLLAEPRRIDDGGLVEESGVGRDAADVTGVHGCVP